MIRKIFLVLIFLISGTAFSQWPSNLNELSTSLCVVEFYQPQSQSLEVTGKTRFKRNLTGILVSADGLVVTTESLYPANLDISSGSVINFSSQLPEDITCKFKDEKKYTAQFIGKDEETGLAFVRIENPDGLPKPVRFHPMKNIVIGDPLFIIEHMEENFDFAPMVSARHVNAVLEKPRRKLITENNNNMLSPGGLAVNRSGHAIGIVQEVNSGSSRNLEFLPVTNKVTEVLLSEHFTNLLKNPPKIQNIIQGSGKSWLGVQMQILTADMASYWGLPVKYGIIVNSVVPQSPAEKAGIEVGDIIYRIGDFELGDENEKNLESFRNYVRNLPEGPVGLLLLKNKNKRKIEVVLESAPKSQYLADEYPVEAWGLGVKELTQDIFLRNDYDFDTEGVWVSRVENAGIAGLSGVKINDIIQSVNSHTIRNLEDFKNSVTAAIDARSKLIMISILRNSKTEFLFLKTRNGK